MTGLPGCGKTTAVAKAIESLKCRKAVGFYTKEIRKGNVRKGFGWNRLDGASGTLAHLEFKSRFTVGKYGVDIAGFENEVLPVLDVEQGDAELFVIDEIGKMECLSEKFVAAVRRLLACDKALLATVAIKGTGLISEVKTIPDAKLFNLTRENRDETLSEIVEILSSLRIPS